MGACELISSSHPANPVTSDCRARPTLDKRYSPIWTAVSSSSNRLPVAPISPIWAAPWAVAAADEQTVVVQTSYGLVPIGWVQSALEVLEPPAGKSRCEWPAWGV